MRRLLPYPQHILSVVLREESCNLVPSQVVVCRVLRDQERLSEITGGEQIDGIVMGGHDALIFGQRVPGGLLRNRHRDAQPPKQGLVLYVQCLP